MVSLVLGLRFINKVKHGLKFGKQIDFCFNAGN